MEIKILGPGCMNCKRLYAEAEKAVAQVGRPATIINFRDSEAGSTTGRGSGW